MEPEEKIRKEGFKFGYLLAQTEPDLVNILAANRNEQSWFFQGLIQGQQEYELQLIRERLKDITKNDPTKDDKEIDKDR